MAHSKQKKKRRSTKGKSNTSKGPTKIQKKKFQEQGQYPRVSPNWHRYRQLEPSKFIQSSFRNVPLSHTNYKGKVKGQRAIVGKLKSTKKWKIQSILKKKPKS